MGKKSIMMSALAVNEKMTRYDNGEVKDNILSIPRTCKNPKLCSKLSATKPLP